MHVDGGVWFSRPGGLVFGGGVWCVVYGGDLWCVVYGTLVVNHCHRQEVTPLSLSPLPHELPSVSYK